MLFEWNEQKNRQNRKKHKIDFKTAARVFADENRIEYYDVLHSEEEDRYITIGVINGVVTVIFVVYTEKENCIRIISARKANESERRMYYEQNKH